MDVAHAVSAVGQDAHPLTGAATDYDPLLEMIGDARFVLLGEATHGTHEFYHRRAEITQRLIVEKGFNAIAVEADWPDAYRVNRFIRGIGPDRLGIESLEDFKRFPTWMWRNADVLDLVGWLREHNQRLPHVARAGFYGLDLYSLSTSIEAVIKYLDQVDPPAAERARGRYSCFDHYSDPQEYGYATSLGITRKCEDEAVEQLIDLRRHALDYLRRDGLVAEDELFFAEQNARLVERAEEYYRSMFSGGVSTWNLRDRHMVETLSALSAHLARLGPPPRIVVWEHNSHIGDARATEMGHVGELNVGQLVREKYGRDSVLIGFTTCSGTVSAANDWGGDVQRMRVRPALEGSCEALFHETGVPEFLLPLRNNASAELLREPMLERAIGVVYRPRTERLSHYFRARLSEQFDAVMHLDHTRAVEPLEVTAEWQRGEPPETYPTGL